MTQIEAGPYELVKAEPFEKMTFCLMDDNSISERTYNKYGNVMCQATRKFADLTSALGELESTLNKLKAQKYIEQPQPKSAEPKTLGKRPAKA